MKLPIITKFRSINIGIYCAFMAIFNLLFSWVPMCIYIMPIPILGVLIMTWFIVISLVGLVLSLTIFLPIEVILFTTKTLKPLDVKLKKWLSILIICLAILILLISMRFWYGFWILGILKNPNLD